MKPKKNFVSNMVYDTRHALRETQTKFGKRFKVGPAAVCKWEQGKTLPDYFIITKIQKLFLKNKKAVL